ncbi:MAG: divergent polysaccharide deacetylase family protein [Alphaproteobacteria bacterium]|nr:divergent polysaccharide deacetylase family protein [Alphaproteobacteria bacterium]
MAKKKAKTRLPRWLPGRIRLSVVAAALLVFAGLFAVIHASRVPEPRSSDHLRVNLPPPPRPAPSRSSEPARPPATSAPAPAPASPAAPAQTAPSPVVPPPSSSGLPAWRRFAAATPQATEDRKLIAIVIDDMGVDRKRSQRAAALPGPLTLSWLPYAQEVGQQAAAARAAGHEILLHAPMQPQGHEDPGPNALLTSLSADEIRRRLDADLDRLPEAVGLNNHEGSLFTRDARAMAPVIDELKRRGLLFLDSRTTGASIGADAARTASVPYAVRDVFLDNVQTIDAVRAQLAEVEAIARRRGFAVAIGHPHDATIEALEPWLRGLAARGFVEVPISAIVKYRIEHPSTADAAAPG